MLDLLHPIYQPTAAYGHFGREPGAIKYKCAETGKTHSCTGFTWEKTDRAEALEADA